MKRIAVAQWRQESNSFNPNPTRLADYQRFGLARQTDDILGRFGTVDELGGFVSRLDAERGVAIVPLLRAVAWSGGPLAAGVYDELSQALLAPLAELGPFDGVLLSLHGATAAEGEPDVCGAVTAAARAIVGPHVPIAVTLDLHANLTRRLLAAADLVVGYRCNPHVDMADTGARAAGLLLDMLAGKLRPVTAMRKVPVLIGAERQSTFDGPLGEVNAAMRAAEEAHQAVNCNQYPVQPWLDVPDLASAVLVTTNGDAAGADALAEQFADLLWAQRDRCSEPLLPPEEIARRVAEAKAFPVVISDGADSTNSGAPGDSTVLLRAFLKARTPGPILLSMVDPVAAQACARAGVGAALTLPIGGKLDPKTGPPVTLTGQVRACSDGRYRLTGHGADNIEVDAGLSVVFEAGDIQLAITSHTVVGSHPKVYQSLGLAPDRARAVVAKSPYGFRHDYGPFAAEILLADCPGSATGNYRRLQFGQARHELYPLVELADRHTPAMSAYSVNAGAPDA